ncbi:hypothetical protein L7F22_025499 [Adiantum nelumboides]|nr:hypothetical protein [Adiantum nelumboides]
MRLLPYAESRHTKFHASTRDTLIVNFTKKLERLVAKQASTWLYSSGPQISMNARHRSFMTDERKALPMLDRVSLQEDLDVKLDVQFERLLNAIDSVIKQLHTAFEGLHERVDCLQASLVDDYNLEWKKMKDHLDQVGTSDNGLSKRSTQLGRSIDGLNSLEETTEVAREDIRLLTRLLIVEKDADLMLERDFQDRQAMDHCVASHLFRTSNILAQMQSVMGTGSGSKFATEDCNETHFKRLYRKGQKSLEAMADWEEEKWEGQKSLEAIVIERRRNDEENKIEDEGDMSQATQQVLPTIDEETPFHKGDAMSTQEVVEHESDFVAQKPSNDMNKGSENMLPTIGETQIHEGNTRNSEEKMVVVENQSDVQTSSDDLIIKDTYSMPLRDEEVEGSEKKDEANEEHQGALATTEVQDKVDKGTREATRNANKAQSIQGRVQGTEGEEREIQERLRREEEEEERKILEHLRREEEEEERKILEHLRRQEEEEAQKKEELAVHYKRPRRRKYLDPYFMDEL